MKLEICNRQARLPLRTRNLSRLTRWLVARTATPGSLPSWSEVVLVLTDNAGITPLNRVFFGKDHPTDVISCAYPPLPGKTGGLGEIYVNVERAAELSRGAVNQSRELALYIAHGVDHLSGASDRTPALRARMLRRERGWLKEADAMGLPGGLVER